MLQPKNEGVKASTILLILSFFTFFISSAIPTSSKQVIEDGYYVGYPLLESINGFGWIVFFAILILTIILSLQSYRGGLNIGLSSIVVIGYLILGGIVSETPKDVESSREAGYYLFWAALVMLFIANIITRIFPNEIVIFGGPADKKLSDELPAESPSGLRER